MGRKSKVASVEQQSDSKENSPDGASTTTDTAAATDAAASTETAEQGKTIKIDDLSKWMSADERSHSVRVETVNGMLSFRLRPVSYGKFGEIRKNIKKPEPPMRKIGTGEEPDLQNEDYLDELEFYEFKRKVAFVDLALVDFKFPGENNEEKAKWVFKNFYRSGEIDAVYTEACFVSGQHAMRSETEVKEVVISSIDDWQKMNNKKTSLKLNYNEFSYIFEFRGLSGKELKEINDATRVGPPPIKMLPKPGVGPRRAVPKPDPDDPRYVEKQKQMSMAQHVMKIEKASGTSIPAETLSEKIEWIEARPVFEVIEILKFLRDENQGFGGEVDFLSKS